MRYSLKITSSGKGLFAISSDIKIKKGSICGLKRNAANIHGGAYDNLFTILNEWFLVQ